MLMPEKQDTTRIEAAAKALYEGADQFGRPSPATWEEMLTYGGRSPGNTDHPLAYEYRRMARSAIEAYLAAGDEESDRA